MKRFMLFFLMVMAVRLAAAQDLLPLDEETGKIVFTEVVQVDNNDKNQLYSKAKKIGSSKKEDILQDDSNEGIYKIKGQFNVKYPSPMRGMFHNGVVKYTLTIMARDGRYKYEITDLEHFSPKGDGGKLESKLPECGKYVLTEGGWSVIKKESRKEIDQIVESLKSTMAKAYKDPAAKDDW